MSDFNVNIDNSALNHQSRTAKMQFISQLKELDFVDSYDLFSPDDHHKLYQHTWHNMSNTISSRIDYI